jgi:hypothetical protein
VPRLGDCRPARALLEQHLVGRADGNQSLQSGRRNQESAMSIFGDGKKSETLGEVKKAETPAATAKPAGEAQTPTIRYVDMPECKETFADSVTSAYFDGQSLRIEFGVTRLDELKPNTPVTGRRYPAQRMVLTPLAAVELINRMQQVAAALTQAGVVKAAPKPATNP